MTIKAKLTIYNGAVISVLFLIFSLIIYQSLSLRLMNAARETVKDSLNRLIDNADKGAHLNNRLLSGVDRSVFVAVRRRDGRIIFTSAGGEDGEQQGSDRLWRQALARQKPVTGMAEISAEAPDLVTAKPMIIAGRLVIVEVAKPLGDSLDAIITLRSILLTAGILFVVVSLAGGYAIAFISLRPVQNLAAAAEKISSQNLNERLPVKNSDEIGRLTIALNRLLSRLEDVFNKQRRFVSDAAHELATPLAGIRGAIGILKSWGAAKPNVRRETISMIDHESLRLVDLIDKLLTLTTLDEEPPLKREDLSLLSSVRQLVDELPAADGQPRVELKIDPDISLYADRWRFESLMRILIDNAFKHIAADGTLSIKAVRQGNAVTVSVIDNGEGIPAADLPYIFDRFHRADKARAAGTGGAGLGLAIAKSIVEAHGGQISARSTLGQGTTIEFSLPGRAKM